MSERAIGVDVGGTLTKLVLLEAPGEVIETIEVASVFEAPEAAVGAISTATGRWRDDDAHRPVGIGVAVPGLVERDVGRVIRAPNLDVLDEFSIGIALEVATGLPVELDNDAHAFGLAEAVLGAAAGCRSAVCLTVGTGLGGAIIHEGRLWRGHGGFAGEVGRLVLDPDAGRFLEQDVAAGAVVDAYRRLAEHPDAELDAARVASLADGGDNAARQALAACGKRLGLGLAVLVNVFNPERIVVGGGVAGAGEWYLTPAREEGARRAWPQSWSQCRVVPASLGPGAGAIGAALMALQAGE